MIFWTKKCWQPKWRLWHDLLHLTNSERSMYTSARMAKKPRVAAEYAERARILTVALQNLLQVALVEWADVDDETRIPHVTADDANAVAASHIHERLPVGDDPARTVLLKLGEVMTERRCDPLFPKLRAPVQPS